MPLRRYRRHAATLIGLIGRHALGESDAATTGTECQGESESESMLANFHDPSPSELLGPFRPLLTLFGYVLHRGQSHVTVTFTFVSLWSSDIVHSPRLANKAHGFVLFKC